MKPLGLRLPEPWTASQRGVLIVLLAGILVFLVVRLILNPVYVPDPQPEAPSRAAELEDRIDPNTADWQTLAALPMIGEKRAKDIVEYRENHQIGHPGETAFKQADDLMIIRGIGPAMVAQLGPYLRFRQTSEQPATLP